MGTGSITHNLRLGPAARRAPSPEIPASAAFRAWFAERSAARDWASLWRYRALAPEAEFMHPTDEHLLPWFIAAGAGGTGQAPLRLHAGVAGGHLGMDAYAFGADAPALARAVEALATTA